MEVCGVYLQVKENFWNAPSLYTILMLQIQQILAVAVLLIQP